MGRGVLGQFQHSHQTEFHQKIANLGDTQNRITDVATVKPTPLGLRYKTIDSHAMSAINHTARRAGHKATVRTDLRTGHFLINVVTARKGKQRWG